MVRVKFGKRGTSYSYPKLMIDKDGMIIFVNEKEKGIVLFAGKDRHFEIGDITDWDMSYFTDFTGTISLTNEKEA